MIKLTIEDLQEIADFKVIEKPLIQKPLIAESDVVTIDNNLSTYVTGTQKRELTVNLGYLDREGYEILRGFRDRQYENLKYPKASIIADIDIAPDGQIIESDITKSFNLTTNDNPLGVKSIELVKIGDNEDYIFEDNGRFYVHKATAKIASYNGETITTDYISATGGLTTGATVYYVLATPVEYEITKDTLVELRYARTYVGQTNVWTEGNGYDLPVKLDYSYQKDGAYLPVQITDSAYANLNDTLDAPLDITKLGGDTFQQTTHTGKNLCNGISQGYFINNAANGCGKTDSDSGLAIAVQANTNYTVSTTKTQTRYRVAVLSTLPTSSAIVGAYNGINKDNKSESITINSGSYSYLVVNATDLSAIQVEVGSTATPFEPYVAPSPTPDYPQEVEVVTGRQVINSCGKNVLGSEWESGTYNTSTGEKSTGSGYRTKDFVKVTPGAQYIISRDSAGVAMNVCCYDMEKNFLRYQTGASVSAGSAFTLANDVEFVTLYRGTSGGIEKMQMEKGSTITSFEPYLGKEIEINLGKNLFNASLNKVSQQFNATASISGNGLKITGSSSGSSHYVTVPIQNVSNILGKSTTISCKYSGDATQIMVYTVNSSGQANAFVGQVTMANGVAAKTLTMPSSLGSDIGIGVVFYTNANSEAIFTDIQVELGSTATSYAPYFTPIELCKIDGYQDKIYKSDGKWWLHKEIKKRNLADYKDLAWWVSGTHVVKINWAILGDSDFVKPDDIDTMGVMMSNYFTNTTGRNLYNGTVLAGCAIGGDGLYFSNNDWTVNDFKTFITNNVVNIYNALATPTDTELTNEDLVTQLEDLWSTYGFSEYTTIATSADDTGNAKPVLEATQGDITGKGTDYTLEGTKKMPMEYKVYGQAIQNGTPSTSTPIPIETVKGNNSITFTGPSGRKEYSIVGKMTLADQRIIDNCGTAEQVQVVFRESKQI